MEFLAAFPAVLTHTIPCFPFFTGKILDAISDSRSNIMVKFLNASFESCHWINSFLNRMAIFTGMILIPYYMQRFAVRRLDELGAIWA